MTALHAVVDFVAYVLALYAIAHKVACRRRWKVVLDEIDKTVKLAKSFENLRK